MLSASWSPPLFCGIPLEPSELLEPEEPLEPAEPDEPSPLEDAPDPDEPEEPSEGDWEEGALVLPLPFELEELEPPHPLAAKASTKPTLSRPATRVRVSNIGITVVRGAVTERFVGCGDGWHAAPLCACGAEDRLSIEHTDAVRWRSFPAVF